MSKPANRRDLPISAIDLTFKSFEKKMLKSMNISFIKKSSKNFGYLFCVFKSDLKEHHRGRDGSSVHWFTPLMSTKTSAELDKSQEQLHMGIGLNNMGHPLLLLQGIRELAQTRVARD